MGDGVGSACEYAKTLGCTRLTALAGVIPDSADPVALNNTFVENLQYAADEAAKVGATVMVEAINTRDIPGFFVHRTNHTLQVIALVDRARDRRQAFADRYGIGATFDDVEDLDPLLLEDILRLAHRHERTSDLFGRFRARLGLPDPDGTTDTEDSETDSPDQEHK